jgi:hypothetical protein
MIGALLATFRCDLISTSMRREFMATQTTAPKAASTNTQSELIRKDAWWTSPLGFFLLFSAFGLWATFRAFQNNYFEFQNYLSPFYSPTLPLHIALPQGLPAPAGGWVISPALYILVFPLSFRLTCYYYRKSIYRSYLADPAGCAVPEPAALAKARFRKYNGERAFPLIAMNFHRFAFYAAVIFIIWLWKDTVDAFLFWNSPSGNNGVHFGIHVGSLVFLINILLLSAYTFSCHSWRHLIGGGLDCYSCSVMNKTRYGMWQKISFLNERHGNWAMMSLCSVALTDVYVFLVSSHAIPDIAIFG